MMNPKKPDDYYRQYKPRKRRYITTPHNPDDDEVMDDKGIPNFDEWGGISYDDFGNN